MPVGLVFWGLWLSQIGCSTHAKRLIEPRQSFYSNDLPAAHASFAKLSEGTRSDHTVAELDLAVVELFQNQPASAERRLRKVRDRWEELEAKSIGEEAHSLLTDDQKRAYSGETYEQLLIGTFLTLSSLMQDGVDAESYSLQTLLKQREIVGRSQDNKDQPPLPELFGIPATAPYLRGVLREATLHDYDDAARMYELTAALQPDHPVVMQDLDRVRTGSHSQPGHGVVYVIALVGRGPYKVETTAPVTQAVMLQADQIISILGDYSIPPTIAPVKIPALECPPKLFDLVGVEVDGTPTATTLPLTDMQQLAGQTYQEKLPKIMARTVARRIIKKGTVYAAKSQIQANQLASLALDAAGVAWEATESADTRCWGLLPREIQILRLELTAGQHHLALEPITAGRPVAPKSQCTVEVIDARNTYVLGYWPDRHLVGQLLVSTP